MGLFFDFTDLFISIFNLIGGIFYILADFFLSGPITSLIN